MGDTYRISQCLIPKIGILQIELDGKKNESNEI